MIVERKGMMGQGKEGSEKGKGMGKKGMEG